MGLGKINKKKKRKERDKGIRMGSEPLGGSCEGGNISAHLEIPSQVRTRRGSLESQRGTQ